MKKAYTPATALLTPEDLIETTIAFRINVLQEKDRTVAAISIKERAGQCDYI